MHSLSVVTCVIELCCLYGAIAIKQTWSEDFQSIGRKLLHEGRMIMLSVNS